MSERLSSPPLFYTFAQIIFGPARKIEDFIIELQERMLENGYPDFSEEQLPNIVPEPKGNLPAKTEKRWIFTDIPRHNGYLLSSNMLIFHTTAYTTFEDFVENIIEGVKLLHRTFTLSFIQRVGVRYIDIITPEKGESLGAYINEGVMGFIKEDDTDLQSISSESIKKAGEGTLVVRTLLRPKSPPYIMPGELLPLNLLPAKKSPDELATRAVIDEDFFVTERFEYDVEILRKKF